MMITQDRLKSVIFYDSALGVFLWKKQLAPRSPLGSFAGCKDKRKGRTSIRIDGKLYLAHRLAWLYMNGSMPQTIDHIDGDPSNNKINNLRNVTQKQNVWNSKKRSNNTSGQKGVSFCPERNKWVASLRIGGVFVLHKRYKSFQEAKEEYLKFARSHQGEFFREAG